MIPEFFGRPVYLLNKRQIEACLCYLRLQRVGRGLTAGEMDYFLELGHAPQLKS